MYFEAESNGIKYEINVREDRTQWIVGLKKENTDWKYHNVPKENYQKMDDTISFLFNNSSYLVDVIGEGTKYSVYTRGSFRSLNIYNDEMLLHESLKAGGSISGGNDLTAGMPGKIVKIFVEKGQAVKEGEPLIVVEAMKMENEMKAHKDCVVKDVLVSVGQNVEGDVTLISFENDKK